MFEIIATVTLQKVINPFGLSLSPRVKFEAYLSLYLELKYQTCLQTELRRDS